MPAVVDPAFFDPSAVVQNGNRHLNGGASMAAALPQVLQPQPGSTLPKLGPSSVGAAAAVAAMAAVDSARSQLMRLKAEDGATVPVEDKEEDEGPEAKRVDRALRNRQSAAASRERKKYHLGELERRVAILSQQNALMQTEQLAAIRQRIGEEKKLNEDNTMLKRNCRVKDMKIETLSRQLNIWTLLADKTFKPVKKSKTWDSTTYERKEIQKAMKMARQVMIADNVEEGGDVVSAS